MNKTKKYFNKEKLKFFYNKGYFHLFFVLIALTVSFIYGWYYDDSKPVSGRGWADQSLYIQVTEKLAQGQLPESSELHYAIGYSTLGVVGYWVNSMDPFFVVSMVLLLVSAIFCFIAAKRLIGKWWALLFSVMLFAWDGVARTFNFSSELFAIPWNNQVIFLLFSYYFWLLTTKIKTKPSYKIIIATGFVSGLAILTREEAVLFVAPALLTYLLLTRADWKRWLVIGSVVVLCFIPQVWVKFAVNGQFSSGRDTSYEETSGRYLQPRLLYRNVWEVLVDSQHFGNPNGITNMLTPTDEDLYKVGGPDPLREALLQAAPWLWISPIGIILLLTRKKYGVGIKVFTILTVLLMTFYLSGVNMSGQKLKFHTLRYISASFILLNLGTVLVIKEGVEYGRRIAKKTTKETVNKRE